MPGGKPTVSSAGYYCPYESAAIPIRCPEGYYCRRGVSSPMDCNSISRCDAGSISRSVASVAIVILVVIAIALLVLSTEVLKLMLKRKSKSANNAAAMHQSVSQAFQTLVNFIAPTVHVGMTGGPLQGLTKDIRYSLSMTLKSNGDTVLDGVTGRFPLEVSLTTFMNALACRALYGGENGNVSLYGVTGSTTETIPGLVGFVPHNDLTVDQNLLISARLRLPHLLPINKQRAIVEDVLRQRCRIA